MIQFYKFHKIQMSTLNLFHTNSVISQPNFCNGLPKYGTPNLKNCFLYCYLMVWVHSHLPRYMFLHNGYLKHFFDVVVKKFEDVNEANPQFVFT